MEHHAYLLLGEQEEVSSYLADLFASEGIVTAGNPDVRIYAENVFAVDDARELGEQAIAKAFGDKKIFVIHAEKFTPEAQNALLKTFEDPVPNTHFFISAREQSIFLSTLLSRLRTVRVGGELEPAKEAKKFLTKTPKQRIDFAKRFADGVKEGEKGAGALAEFLDSLLLILKEEKAPMDTLKKIVKLRAYARDSAVMPRLIIEHLALVL